MGHGWQMHHERRSATLALAVPATAQTPRIPTAADSANFSWRASRPAEDVIASPPWERSGWLLSSMPRIGICGDDDDVAELVSTTFYLVSQDTAFITNHTRAIECGT